MFFESFTLDLGESQSCRLQIEAKLLERDLLIKNFLICLFLSFIENFIAFIIYLFIKNFVTESFLEKSTDLIFQFFTDYQYLTQATFMIN